MFPTVTYFFRNYNLRLERTIRGHSLPPLPPICRKCSPEGRKFVQGHTASYWHGQDRILLANPTASFSCLVSHSPWAFQPESILGNNKYESVCKQLSKPEAPVVVTGGGKGERRTCVDLWTKHLPHTWRHARSPGTKETNRSNGEFMSSALQRRGIQ